MQVFEFHFNPDKETDFHFDSFCYNPNNIYEKKLGNLYILGSLKRAFDKKALIQKLAKGIKDNYYRLSGHSIQKAFNKSVKEANEFLQEKKDKAEVSWMGNLGFTIVSLKDKKLNLTKTGGTKVFLLRGDKKIDIDSQFNSKNEIDPSSDEFKNIASSELAENDILILATDEVAKIFQEKNIFNLLVQAIPLSEKKIRRILYKKQLDFSQLKGACLILSLNKNKKDHIKKILPAPNSSRFSFERFSIGGLSKIKNLVNAINLPKLPKISIQKPELDFNLPSLPSFSIERINLRPIKFKKNILLLIGFCLLLLIGFYLFQRDQQQKLMAFKDELANIKERAIKAEGLIQDEKKDQSRKILLDSKKEISNLSTQVSLSKETKQSISELEKRIENDLAELHSLVKVKTIKKITKFKPEEFTPQNLTLIGEEIYLSSSFEKDIYRINLNNPQPEKISINSKIKFSSKLDILSLPIFITEKNKVKILEDGKIKEKRNLNDLAIKDFTTYSNNLYLLTENGAILKSSYSGGLKWNSPTVWLNEKEKSTAGEVFAVDKNIWILDKQNRIKKYYRGQLEDSIITKLYPETKNVSEFYTNNNLDFLYLLDTDTNRILILNKDGSIHKQLQSDNFNNPIDFSISKDGEIAYLLTNNLELISVNLF